MKKTVIVEVTRLAPHPEYIKVVKHRKRYLAHDENGVSKVGDKVSIVESKPISKLKRWRVAKVIQKD